jgi:hypothetical protein
MRFVRWIPTFLGFPIGGLLAVQTVGSIDGPVSGAIAGALAGAVIGTTQWLALRPTGIGAQWIAATTVALAAGTALAAAITDSGTGAGDLAIGGLIAGLAIGGAQGWVLGRGIRITAIWAATVGLAWMLGWLTTWSIGVDVERGYAVFGSSGAVVVTVLTGLVLLRLLVRGRPAPIAGAIA